MSTSTQSYLQCLAYITDPNLHMHAPQRALVGAFVIEWAKYIYIVLFYMLQGILNSFHSRQQEALHLLLGLSANANCDLSSQCHNVVIVVSCAMCEV